jgi:CDP-diacylglycerol--glycerol-3-phosphate 3-phosphatidyltransferase
VTNSERPSPPSRWASIPAALIVFRVLLGPILLGCAIAGAIGWWFFAGLTPALLSDVFDGIIARRVGASTEQLRLWDGYADTWFYVLMAAAVWFHARAAVESLALPLLVLVAAHVALYAFCYRKYGRGPSYHGVTAKAWGLGLFVAFVLAFATAQTVAALWIALALGYLNALDEIVMTALLPRWHQDVLTMPKALALRRMDLAQSAAADSAG